jgi:hypothetical protein
MHAFSPDTGVGSVHLFIFTVDIASEGNVGVLCLSVKGQDTRFATSFLKKRTKDGDKDVPSRNPFTDDGLPTDDESGTMGRGRL